MCYFGNIRMSGPLKWICSFLVCISLYACEAADAVVEDQVCQPGQDNEQQQCTTGWNDSGPITFVSTSSDLPTIVEVTMSNFTAIEITGCDSISEAASKHLPGYAVINSLAHGHNTLLRKGDVVIAINERAFRRSLPESTCEEFLELWDIVATRNSPVTITVERYDWDAPPHAWPRFLRASKSDSKVALERYQKHLAWREATFPMDIASPGMQTIFSLRIICEIHPNKDEDFAPTLYVDYGRMQTMLLAGDIAAQDVVTAFTLFTEQGLAASDDPRHPKMSRFIDISEFPSIMDFRVDTLKLIYTTLDPNYPDTLSKMVLFPVRPLMSKIARALLSFIRSETTKKKFLITNNLDQVSELGWNKTEIMESGGVKQFVADRAKPLERSFFVY